MKKCILLLAILLIGNFASATKSYLSDTTLMGDSVPKLNSDLAFNLCFNSLLYWHGISIQQDSLITQFRAKITAYEKITGYQGNSVEDLERVYEIGNALKEEDRLKIEGLEKDLKKVNRVNGVLKVGMFVVPTATLVGGIWIGTKIIR